MKTKILYSLILSGLFIFFACKKELNWKVGNTDSRIVVEATFTDEYKKQSVFVSQTTDFYSEKNNVALTDAQVSITDGVNTYLFNHIGNGEYQSIDSVSAMMGKTYTLNLNLNTPINEQTKYTATSTMKGYFRLDTVFCQILGWEELTEQDTFTELILGVYGQEAKSTSDYYIFNVKKNGDDAKMKFDEMAAFSDEIDNGMTEFSFTTYIKGKLNAGDTINVTILSVSDKYLDYLNEITQEIDRVDPFGMMGPPANPKGNISNEGLGFFNVSAVSKIEHIVIEGIR